MRNLTRIGLALLLIAAVAGCSTTTKPDMTEPSVPEATTPEPTVNPLLSAWEGPYGGIPPFDENPGPHFVLLAKLAQQCGLEKLSMGMSADFETAVAFGATSIRVGSAIFGSRTPASAQSVGSMSLVTVFVSLVCGVVIRAGHSITPGTRVPPS